MMEAPSCSGFECVLFLVAVAVFFHVAGTAAALAGLTAGELVRPLSSRVGLQPWDSPIRIVGFVAVVWLTLQLVLAAPCQIAKGPPSATRSAHNLRYVKLVPLAHLELSARSVAPVHVAALLHRRGTRHVRSCAA